MIENDMVRLREQGGVFKIREVLVEYCLLEERGKVRGETRGSTTRGDMLTVGTRRARVTYSQGGREGGGRVERERERERLF